MASAHGQYNVSLALKTPTFTCACSVDIEKHGCETDAPRKIHAQKALELLVADSRVSRVHLVVTETGQRLFAEELGIASGDLQHLVSREDVGASIASGS